MAQSIGAVALDIVMGKNTVSGVAKQAIADVQKTFNDGSATITSKVSAVGTACKQVGASMAPVSLAAQGVIKSTASAAMSFETAMAQVQTIAGNASVSYKGNMTDMSKAIMQLSTDTGVAAEDVALATYNAISAGVDVSKSVEFVATANALAVGGFTDMTTSVDVLTTTLNAYGDKAGTAESISDKLITTQNLGKTTVNELASSMGKVIPTASAYGISIDNLCASYVAMTKGGIATAESTTYMKSMFNELADSGSNVGKILQDQTGKSFGQLMSEGKSLADVIDILGQSVNGDSEAFAQLWGSSEAGTGALAILNGGTADFDNTLKEMGNSTGAASDAMGKMTDTDAHNMQVAMNDMKNAAIELGGAFAPVMSTLAGAVSTVVKAFSDLPSPVQNVIAVILGVVAVVSPLLMGIGSIISVVGSLGSVIGTIGGVLSGFIGFITATVIPALGSFFAFLIANPIILIIGAIIAIGALLITHWDEVKAVAEKVWNGICEVVSVVWEAIKGAISTAIEFIGNFISNYFNFWLNLASTIWEGIKNAFNTALEFIRGLISTVFEFVKNLFINYFNFWKNLVETVWNAIKNAFTMYLNMIKTVVSTVFNAIKNTITTVVNAIKSVITTVFNTIKAVITTIVNAIKSTISNVWNGIKSTITSVVNGIKNTVSRVFNNMLSAIRNTVNNIASAIKSGFNNAVSFITGLKDKAFTWGKDMIMGIVNGIKSCIGKVGDAVNDVAGKIKSVLHFSVPDEGPLTDYETWMPDFIAGMTKGINDNKYKLVDAVKGMAGEMVMPAINAPVLHNVSNAGITQASNTSDDRLYGLLTQLISKLDNNSNNGDITIPVYLGNDLLDEQIISASDRRTLRSGGRA